MEIILDIISKQYRLVGGSYPSDETDFEKYPCIFFNPENDQIDIMHARHYDNSYEERIEQSDAFLKILGLEASGFRTPHHGSKLVFNFLR